MNVTVENLAPCKKLVRVEIDSQEVEAAFESMTKDFQHRVSLPGFRPGKAPRDMIARRFEKDIQDEVKRKLIPDAYKKAVDEKSLDVIGYPDIEEIQFARGQSLQFAATVETAPDFQLPEYKGLPVKRDTTTVTEADIQRALELLRERKGSYQPVDRPAATGDVAVVNYTGTCDGKPITETAPVAKGLTEQKGFWIHLRPNEFIPGFGEQLTGAKAGEHRTVNVDFPADFVTPQLAGKKGVYEVDLVEVRALNLPTLDEAFAKEYGAESLEKLTAGVREDLENELKLKKDRDTRRQMIDALLARVSFDLPETAVKQETRNVVFDIVRENQSRGVPKDLIEQQKDAIYSAASDGAKTRVKVNFILQKIAEKEEIKVSQEEVAVRIQTLAGMYNIPPAQFIKDLQKRNGIMQIYDQIAEGKVLEFLQANAKIEDAPPAPTPPAAAS